jgi:hypothetical protein
MKVAYYTLYLRVNMVEVNPDGLPIVSKDIHENITRKF